MSIGSLALNAIKHVMPSPKTLAYLTGGALAGEGAYQSLQGKESYISKLAKVLADAFYTPEEYTGPKPMDKKDFLLQKSSMVLGDNKVQELLANKVSPEKIYETALQVKDLRSKNAKNPYGLPDYARNIDRYEIDDSGNFINLNKKYNAEDALKLDAESRIKLLADIGDIIQKRRQYTDDVVMPKKRYTSLK